MSLRVEGINSYYRKSHVLHDVSLAVEDGQLVTLIGRNGAGKTTTLKSIMGLVDVRSGSITFEGDELVGEPAYEIAQRGLSMIPEHRDIVPGLTVRENLKLGYVGHESDRPFDELVDKVCEYFPRLAERQEQNAITMSGGEQQMLAIARALMAEPEMLLVDEPTEGLMPTLVEDLREILPAINADGISILLVEQNVQLALDISDYGYVINEGFIEAEGTTDELRGRDDLDELLVI
jgi:branched-chain amino acid transport system ATP-binding protein